MYLVSSIRAQYKTTKVARNTSIAEPRVPLGGGGEEVGMARKSLGMGEREKYRKLSTSSGGKALMLKNRNNQSSIFFWWSKLVLSPWP